VRRVTQRQGSTVRLLRELSGIGFMPEALWGRHTRWLTVITVDPAQFGSVRETIRLALEAQYIEARPRPAGTRKPMRMRPVFCGCETVGGGVAADFFARGLCLPSGSNLTEVDLERVAAVVRSTAR